MLSDWNIGYEVWPTSESGTVLTARKVKRSLGYLMQFPDAVGCLCHLLCAAPEGVFAVMLKDDNMDRNGFSVWCFPTIHLNAKKFSKNSVAELSE